LVTAFTKMSVLLLYHRIFPQDWLRKAVYLGCVLFLIQGTVFFFLVVFQCNPVGLVYDKTLTGSCLNIHAITLAGSAVALFDDIAVIILPIPSILKLRLRLGRKLSVVSIMCVGLM
jgi:hypothetical protein